MRGGHRRLALGLFRTRPHRDLLEHALSSGITDLDVAATYHHGQAHRLLAEAAQGLIEHFTISTKLSPRPEQTPLWTQARQAVDELGVIPTVMLVHNPEHVVRSMPPAQARYWWADVAEQMARLVASGVCQAWGIATWDPRPLLPILTSDGPSPAPEVVMIRAGLLVPADVLTAADMLLDCLRIAPARRWGMSPFAGEPELLAGAGIHQFLAPNTPTHTTTAVALAASWHLPDVSRIAVGASSPQHLDELGAALNTPVDGERISRYRQRFIARAATR